MCLIQDTQFRYKDTESFMDIFLFCKCKKSIRGQKQTLITTLANWLQQIQ